MRCDDALVAVSVRADSEDFDDAAALDGHLASCAECRRFERAILDVRSQLRVEVVDRAPDLAPAVTARLARGDGPALHRSGGGGRRVAVAAAVAAVAGMVAGATFVGLGGRPRSPAAADIPEQVLAAQHGITSLDGRLTITEAVPGDLGGTRTFDAHLTYRAPESMVLAVQETTTGRSGAERAAGELVVDGDRWWQETTRQCSPAAGRVECPDELLTWSRSVTGREPFSDSAPVPLELVSPVDSFTLAAAPASAGERTIAGRRAVGVTVTVAQVAPVLDGLQAAVELGPVHPADPVELWLDAEHLVPVAFDVRAADDSARARWAAAVGGVDRPGAVVLRVEADQMRINGPEPAGSDAFALPAERAGATTDAGFRPTPDGDPALAVVPVPGTVPGGLRAHRSGTVTTPGGPEVGVRSWSDGRAWLTVRATAEWAGGRLFGDLGPEVRPIDLGRGGTAYAAGDGRRIGLHTDTVDVVVAGSLPLDELRTVVAGLGLRGRPVPAGWAEAATAGLDDAAVVVPGLLTARGAEGFAVDPAVRVDGDTVTEVRAGPGDRTLALTQRAAPALPPPSSGDETGVEVRGIAGRYSAERGELEWVEDGIAVSLRSPTIGLGELVAIADSLEPA
jgi:hypothetical protein